MAEVTSREETYEIRPFVASDAADVADLYDRIWDSDVDGPWLQHRFVNNPFVDRTTMLVADDGDNVVGARPYVAFPVRAGAETGVGLLLVSLMVHPDHRRRGLFTRMTERLVERHADDALVTVNYANDLSAPGYRKLGFTEIGTGPHKDVRVHRPSVFVRNRVGAVAGRPIGLAADVAATVFNHVRTPARSTAGVDVDHRTGIPAGRVAAIAEHADPPTIHTARPPDLYRWLDRNPRWRHRTYLASGDDGDRAALVVAERADDHPGLWIVDALPHDGTALDALEGLLATVVREHRAAPHVAVTGPILNERLLPRSVLAPYGFLPTTNPLLGRVTESQDTVFVYRLGDAPLSTIGGLDVRDSDNWRARIR